MTALNFPKKILHHYQNTNTSQDGRITIGVMSLPRISNFTDIDPLEYEPDVSIKLIEMGDEIGDVDALILPGTRNCVSRPIGPERIWTLPKILPVYQMKYRFLEYVAAIKYLELKL